MGTVMSIVFSLAKRLPWQAYALLIVLAALFGLYRYGYHKGAAIEHAANARMMAAMEEAWANEIVKKQKVVTKVVIKYHERRTHTQDVNRRVLKETRADDAITSFPYPLPGAVRLHFDAAAQAPDSSAAAGADDSPTTLKALTAGAVENFGICHENADRLIALQAYVKAWITQRE